MSQTEIPPTERLDDNDVQAIDELRHEHGMEPGIRLQLLATGGEPLYHPNNLVDFAQNLLARPTDKTSPLSPFSDGTCL